MSSSISPLKVFSPLHLNNFQALPFMLLIESFRKWIAAWNFSPHFPHKRNTRFFISSRCRYRWERTSRKDIFNYNSYEKEFLLSNLSSSLLCKLKRQYTRFSLLVYEKVKYLYRDVIFSVGSSSVVNKKFNNQQTLFTALWGSSLKTTLNCFSLLIFFDASQAVKVINWSQLDNNKD